MLVIGLFGGFCGLMGVGLFRCLREMGLMSWKLR